MYFCSLKRAIGPIHVSVCIIFLGCNYSFLISNKLDRKKYLFTKEPKDPKQCLKMYGIHRNNIEMLWLLGGKGQSAHPWYRFQWARYKFHALWSPVNCPITDQYRISPYNTDAISSWKERRMRRISVTGWFWFVDPKWNSQNDTNRKRIV